MTDLTPEELQTLARFQSPMPPLDVDPLHFAKLLSMALIVQREGGPHLTEAGIERLKEVRGDTYRS
jgi:hypothetical protein